MQDQAPENEHLTMQIASQVFNMKVAANALIFFKDGTPAYITRRFDVKPDGTKYLQEDFAQISGKTKNSDGDNYKYSATWEEIGKLIRKKVAAYPPVLEEFFKVVVFNYIISNGDAHLKNFSLIQSDFGDYMLTKAYDLMCTVLHTPGESGTALDLYEGDSESMYFSTYGYYGKTNFEELAERIGMLQKRSLNIIEYMLGKKMEVSAMVEHSFLSKEAKEKFMFYYNDKLKRFG
jgi:serine/threonine-protein kinase HipA